MRTKIQRWGNSLGLRIPKAFAEGANVVEGSIVDIALEGEDLVIRPVSLRRYDLESLVRAIKPSNLHEPIDTGDAVGRESW